MKKKLSLIIVIMLCTLFVACENTSGEDNNSKSLSTTKENTLSADSEINQTENSNQQNDKELSSENTVQENNTDTDSNDDDAKLPEYTAKENNTDTDSEDDDTKLPEYTPPDKKSDDLGSITVDLNGKSKSYKALLAFDDSIGNGPWSNIFGKSDKIYIQLPSDVGTGDEFTVEDGAMSLDSFGPPEFSFVYTDKRGNDYAIYDANNIYDSFGLIIDKWDGRGGYAEGRFAAEIRPLVGDTIIMKDGRFKVKIRD